MPPNAIAFALRGDYIPLDALLKATHQCSSGGAAKLLIADAQVCVDGIPETRRTRKVRAGQVVQVGETLIRVEADNSATIPG
jgi:ribosome-associated protein